MNFALCLQLEAISARELSMVEASAVAMTIFFAETYIAASGAAFVWRGSASYRPLDAVLLILFFEFPHILGQLSVIPFVCQSEGAGVAVETGFESTLSQSIVVL